jgi:hypothetical protein
MRFFLFALVVAGVVVFAAKSRGETSPTPLEVQVGSGSGQHHEPFTGYDPGPGSWAYSDLSADEKAQADHAKTATNWGAISNGFAAEIQAQSDAAVASSAEHQLGLDDSTAIGVVP